MDPFLAHTLLDTSRHDSPRSSLRNPDNLFPERELPPPDPIARWGIAAADELIESLDERASRTRGIWRRAMVDWSPLFRRLLRIARGTL